MRENERRPSTDRLPVPAVDRNATVISVQFPLSWEPIEPLRQYVVVCAAGAGDKIAGRVGPCSKSCSRTRSSTATCRA